MFKRKDKYVIFCIGSSYGMDSELLKCAGIEYYKFKGIRKKMACELMMVPDCLVCFNPSDGKTIPCKIYEYMATGKPILYLSNSENDECWNLLKNSYENAFNSLDSLIKYENSIYKEYKPKILKSGWSYQCCQT